MLTIPFLGKPLDISASLTASGDTIERKTIWHPLAQMGTDKGPASFYIDSEAGNVNSKKPICPAVESGYQLDTDPAPGFSYGMTDRAHVQAGGDGYWEVSQADNGCILLYCDGRKGSSHVWISGVQIREKRAQHVEKCQPAVTVDFTILPGELKQATLDLSKASSGCTDPKFAAHIVVSDKNANNLYKKDLGIGGNREAALDGWMTFSLSTSGVLEVEYRKSVGGATP